MDGAELRAVVLQIIHELSAQHLSLQSVDVLRRAQTKLDVNKLEDEQALLAFFWDLFRVGVSFLGAQPI